jgi:hypothetical protein
MPCFTKPPEISPNKPAFLEMGNVSPWREDDKLVDLLENNTYIAPGTAIATFFDGRYPNMPHGNHAAIFLRWVGNGMEVFHQWRGRAPPIRVLFFGRAQPQTFLRAEQYSLVA